MDSRKMMGFETPGDQRVSITVREWNGIKLALWRSKVAWEIATRAATEIIGGCSHAHGCPGEQVETEPCLPGCPDREVRMSALVVLSAARMFAPIDARRAASDPYMAPSREFFSEMIAALVTAQGELEALRAALRAAGAEPPVPPQNDEPALTARKPSQLEEYKRDLLDAEAETADTDPAGPDQLEEAPT